MYEWSTVQDPLWCCVCIINSYSNLLNWPIVSLLFLFITLSMCFVLIQDYTLCFTGSPCCKFSYYNYISIWPYYIVIHVYDVHFVKQNSDFVLIMLLRIFFILNQFSIDQTLQIVIIYKHDKFWFLVWKDETFTDTVSYLVKSHPCNFVTICTLRGESCQTTVILQYKLLALILSAVCSVIQQS